MIRLCLVLSAWAALGVCGATLEEDFRSPPDAAKVRVWWHWMGSNVTRYGIERDLRAMRECGVGGATIFWCSDLAGTAEEFEGAPMNPAMKFRNDEWWRLVECAAAEAEKNHIDLGFQNSPGFSMAGGPWVTIEESMKKLVWTKAPLGKPLAHPFVQDGFYRELAVVTNANLVYRFGYTTLGSRPKPAPHEIAAVGYEADKMDPAAMRRHLTEVLGAMKAHLGKRLGTVVTRLVFDSNESGPQNWTEKLPEEFKKRCGYDPIPFLPALAGASMKGGGTFKADFQRVCSDLVNEGTFAVAREMAHQYGLELELEPYGGPIDRASATAYADVPMVEFWAFPSNKKLFGGYPGIPGEVGRKLGKPILASEAFTAAPDTCRFDKTPRHFKRAGDAAYARGINRLYLHDWVHQPFDARWQPGMTMGQWGSHFGENQTWFRPGFAWFAYLNRIQALLQRGLAAADDPARGTDLLATHRRDGTNDIYFVANPNAGNRTVELGFDGAGRLPELFDPLEATVRPADRWRTEGSRTLVTLALAGEGSVFVVFRKSAPSAAAPASEHETVPASVAVDASHGWVLSFAPNRGAPAGEWPLDGLRSWSELPVAGMRYFSGTATYRLRFDCWSFLKMREKSARFVLDLGDVRDLVNARVNGTPLGVRWCPPYRYDITELVKAAYRVPFRERRLDIELEVTNGWHNRLVGDHLEAEDCRWRMPTRAYGRALAEIPSFVRENRARPSSGRVGFCTWDYVCFDTPLEPSGLLGPVTVICE